MGEKSKIIDTFLTFEKCDGPIEKVIADKIKVAFESICSIILDSQLQEVNPLLKKYYVDPSLKNDNARQLYSLLKIDRLISKENKSDDLSALAEDLKKLKNKSSWSKIGNSEDYPKDPHWFPYHVKKIINKIETKEENDTISAEIISMLFMFIRPNEKPNEKAISNDFEIEEREFDVWLNEAIKLFQKHTPNLFNSSVYAYFLGMLLNRYPEAIPYIQESNEDSDVEQTENRDFKKVSISKQFYKRMISLVLINNIECKLSGHIQTDFSSNQTAILEDDDTVIHALSTTLLQRVDTYLLSGCNFQNPLKDWIVKNQRPYNRFRKKLFFVSFAALLYFLRKHERSAEFIESLTDVKYSDIHWSFTDSIFNEPSHAEIDLIQRLRRSFIHDEENILQLFTETENYLKNNQKEEKKIRDRINNACSLQRQKAVRIQKVCSELHNLVYKCDKIDVDFSTFNLDVKKNHPLSSKNDIIVCLKKCEQQHLSQCKNDVYLARDVEKNNIQELKNALEYRNANNSLGISVLEIFRKIEAKIKKMYNEKSQKEVQDHFTEQDLINRLNAFAWKKLEKELDKSACSIPTPITEIEKPPFRLFKNANILVASGQNYEDLCFANNDEYWVCAGAGFASANESRSTDAICNDLITKYLKPACQIDCGGSTSHLDYCSKRFLIFGVTSISLLPQNTRNKVIEWLCKRLNTRINIYERAYQQTMTIMLNILLIQPKLSLEKEICENIIDIVYNRSLYPQQLCILENIKNHPSLNSYLERRMKILSEPRLSEDGRFPSPFCIYLYATKVTHEEKEKKEGKYFTDQKKCGRKTYITLASFAPHNVDDFYKVSVLLNGITWRLVNRDKKNKNTTVDQSVFDILFKTACDFWETYKNEGATDRTLKLTWGTQLLLTSFCNLARDGFFDEIDCWDHKQIFSLALLGDYTQKLYTKGYHDFLDANSLNETKEFFMLSSAMRYTSLLYKASEINKVGPVCLDDEKVQNYASWLTKEKYTRFLILTLRYLTFTDFFEKITPATCKSIYENIPNTVEMCRNPEKFFLPYDEINVKQLNYILSKLSK